MPKIGLKLWSTDIDIIDEAIALHNSGVFDFIELYIVPGTYHEAIARWLSLDVTYVIHCPHTSHGFNIAVRNNLDSNLKKFNEVRRFADTLKADVIVVHAGHGGTLGETIAQLKKISDTRVHIENKPYRGIKGELCVGARPEEITEILQNSPIGGFVLDFTHATCAANSLGLSPDIMLRSFFSLSPAMFHLSDGNLKMTRDVHLNFGKGNFDLKKMLSMIPAGKKITVEAPRDSARGLRDFVDDVKLLETLADTQEPLWPNT